MLKHTGPKAFEVKLNHELQAHGQSKHQKAYLKATKQLCNAGKKDTVLETHHTNIRINGFMRSTSIQLVCAQVSGTLKKASENLMNMYKKNQKPPRTITFI